MTRPASTCFKCTHQGTPSPDQTNLTTGKSVNRLTGSRTEVRLWCPKCLHVWTTNLDDALAHGRFLDRAGLR